MAINWSKEQRQVIEHRKSNLLVSAAAGSGKTAVLVERITQMIQRKEHPVDIDRLLVVTFTNAAAAEMRERIGAAIEKALEDNPDSAHLQRQQTLVHNAKITTMHSFCLNVIRNHFHTIDLEPGFRIADEGEIKLLKADVLKQVLNRFYSGEGITAEEKEAFIQFTESYAPGKNDDALTEMVLKLYEYAMSYPWPKEWLQQSVDNYEQANLQSSWLLGLSAYIKLRVDDTTKQLKEALRLCQDADGPSKYEPALLSDVEQWSKSVDCHTFEELYAWQKKVKFIALGKSTKTDGCDEKRELVKEIRNQAKATLGEFQTAFFGAEPDEQIARMKEAGHYVKTLVTLTEAFMEAFEEKKRTKNLLDFHDQEHLALRILVDEETKHPTEVAREYQKLFAEIMVDEYQDSNYVQETLVRAVSENQDNIFMVGDVKQSIYRFRLARPELFVEKFDSYQLKKEDTDFCQDGMRIDLHQNYRSRSQVTGFANDIFEAIMGRDLGNVEYDEAVALYPAAQYPQGDPKDYETEVILLEPQASEDKVHLEARAAAQKIKQLVGTFPVTDKETGELRPAEYGDIVLLLRSIGERGEVYQEVFSQEGVPLQTPSKTGYFSTLEVNTVLNFLCVIDNPMQDIPLAAVMKSPIFGFTSDELAQIRTKDQQGSFYDAVISLQKMETASDEKTQILQAKVQQFWQVIDSFRDRVPYTSIHALLEQIYEETGYLHYVSVMPAGEQRSANLQMLLEKAVAYEKTSYRGLFHFMRYIEQLKKYEVDFGEAESSDQVLHAVRLMTIHKSKGLEFPIVILSGMGRQFNRRDESAAMVLHPEYGIGLDLIDSERRVKRPLLLKQALKQMTRQEGLGEELRVLYVAMTRAKEKLILTGVLTQKETDKKMDLREQRLFRGQKRLSFEERYTAQSYYAWVLPSLPKETEVQQMTYVDQVLEHANEMLQGYEKKAEILKRFSQVSEDSYKQIEETFAWEYPYSGEVAARQKVSVSELKHRAMERLEQLSEDSVEDTHYEYKPEPMIPYLPRFADRQDEVNQGALRGTAMHRFMECIDFKDVHAHTVEAWIQQFLDEKRMSAAQAELLILAKLEGFLQHPITARMQRAAQNQQYYKERPFVMGRPAEELEMDGEDLVLIQGIIDVYWQEPDGIVVLDYKTDAVKSAQLLADRYRTQLHLYARALEQATGIFVKEIYIYSFALGELIEIEKEEKK